MPKCLKLYKNRTKAAVYRNIQRKSNYKKGRIAQASRRLWYPREVAILIDSSDSDRDIAAQLQRSVQAVQVKRCRIEKTGIPQDVQRILEWMKKEREE